MCFTTFALVVLILLVSQILGIRAIRTCFRMRGSESGNFFGSHYRPLFEREQGSNKTMDHHDNFKRLCLLSFSLGYVPSRKWCTSSLEVSQANLKIRDDMGRVFEYLGTIITALIEDLWLITLAKMANTNRSRNARCNLRFIWFGCLPRNLFHFYGS